MNPIARISHVTIKLHKDNRPIRPIITWENAPSYELAKQLFRILNNYLQLPYTYNIQNSIHLMTDLQTVNINKNTTLCSFKIVNMCIPKNRVRNIIKNILERNHEIEENIQKEIKHILETAIEHLMMADWGRNML
jgi:hypothetical protein